MILFPLAFLSTALVPSQGLRDWLRVISDWNPVSAVAGSCRELFGTRTPRRCRTRFRRSIRCSLR
jgi:hypothetical protein